MGSATNTSAVLIICADGDTGYRLSQLLRRADRHVIAVVRERADPILLERMGCEVIVADPTDRDEVNQLFASREASGLVVVCMLGGTPQLNTQGNINVIDAAAESGVRRFTMLTSIGCGDSADSVDPFVKAFIGKALRAKNWAEKQLQATPMDWTIIRPGGTVRRPSKGQPILVESPKVTGHINVMDLGDAILEALDSPKAVHRVLTAVDSGRAFDISGEPLVRAEL
jgi:uncharacterized protein YbjT (DUF2867 family)